MSDASKNSAELIADLRIGSRATSVKCPSCGSNPGHLCFGNGTMRQAHAVRTSLAESNLRQAAADALESATRVPEQGEASDDRQRTIDDLGEKLAESQAQRQAALDVMNAHRCGEKTERHMASLVAASEVIERVRAIHEPIPIYERAESCGHADDEHTTFESDQGIVLCENSPLGYSICGGCSDDSSADGPVEHPCPTVEALDGAPEPEWEYGLRRKKAEGISWYAHTTGDALDDLAVYKRDHDEVVRRRKAGPWLPVEGESE